jgi:hypothetical protein
MRNNYVNTVIILIFITLSGCAYTVVEVRSVPSLNEWDGRADEKMHTPRDISDVLDVGSVRMSINLSNYKSIYSGLSMFGIEAARDGDDNNAAKDTELALILGIKSKNIKSSYFFAAEKMHLVVNQDSQMLRLSPKAVFQEKKSVVCEWDYNFVGKSWGNKSKKIEHDVIEINPSNDKDDFECFNIIFDVASLKDKNYWALDFTDTQLPLDSHNKVYFQPKKIKWVRSN